MNYYSYLLEECYCLEDHACDVLLERLSNMRSGVGIELCEYRVGGHRRGQVVAESLEVFFNLQWRSL